MESKIETTTSISEETKTDDQLTTNNDNKTCEQEEKFLLQKIPHIIAFINKKSGGKKGERIGIELSKFKVNVFCLYQLTTNNTIFNNLITLIKQYKNNLLIIIAGGDGTMQWGCSIIDNVIKNIKVDDNDIVFPTIVPFPVGTGNDFSNVTGWGKNNPIIRQDNILTMLTNIIYSYQIDRKLFVDRWKIIYKFDDINEDEKLINSIKDKMGNNKNNLDDLQYQIMTNPQSNLYKYINTSNDLPIRNQLLCYLSIGYDAKVVFDFDQSRKYNPKLLGDPVLNKAVYGVHGMKHFFNQISPIIKDISVNADNNDIIIPKESRSFKLMNVNSAADGIFFWGDESKKVGEKILSGEHALMDDGKIELVTTKGARHLMQLRLAQGIKKTNKPGGMRLVQAKKSIIIEIKTSPIYIQIDGEGFKLTKKGTIKVIHNDKIPVLIGYNNPLGVKKEFKIDNIHRYEYEKDPLYSIIKNKLRKIGNIQLPILFKNRSMFSLFERKINNIDINGNGINIELKNISRQSSI